MMKVVVNEKCIGCALCAETCPEVFHMENGVAVAGPAAAGWATPVANAAAGCPVGAIEAEL